MRCPLGGTVDCKVHNWTSELTVLRSIVQNCGLNETAKWGVPCYTFNDRNIVILSAFKDYCALSFFKGSLLTNGGGLLERPGENSQAARLLKFKSAEEIRKVEDKIKACIYEAIEVEKAGLKVDFKKQPEPIPEELLFRLEGDPFLKAAFEALTPGRQRGYILHIAQAKQPKTRLARIEKCLPLILNGIGLHDKYTYNKR